MKRIVILVHGYFKTEKDMYVLKSELEKADFEVININLPLIFKRLKLILPYFKKEVESVKIPSLKDFAVLPYGHKEIHYQPETARLIASFLNCGSFDRGDKNEK